MDSSMREGVGNAFREFIQSDEFAGTTAHKVLSDVGIPILEAACAFRDGKYAECVSRIFSKRYQVMMQEAAPVQKILSLSHTLL